MIDAQPPERADAARNRALILDAAERLFFEHGVERTSMNAIAAAAGVGKGTLFRRFGDRSSLALAVLDMQERALQDGFLHGPPPLGPGAPPARRLVAFGEAMLDHLEANGAILLDAERSARSAVFMSSAPVGARRLHIRGLVEEADVAADVDYLTDVLLLPLSPSVFAHQRQGRDVSLRSLKSGYADLVDRLAGSG